MNKQQEIESGECLGILQANIDLLEKALDKNDQRAVGKHIYILRQTITELSVLLDQVLPPPPDFPADWETKWQPKFEEVTTAPKPKPKKSERKAKPQAGGGEADPF